MIFCRIKCFGCHKQGEAEQSYSIKLPFIDDEEKYESVFCCEDCKMLFEPHQTFFHVLDGPTYTDKERPPFWCNTEQLSYQHFHIAYGQLQILDPIIYADALKENALDTAQLPLSDFPLIEDFEILLEYVIDKYENDKETKGDVFVWLFSPSRGYLAHFIDHDTGRDLCRPDFTIPHGDFQTPYSDLEQGWNILMAEDELFVYIMTGNWEIDEWYSTWFKVEKHRYYREWQHAIQRCREQHASTEH